MLTLADVQKSAVLSDDVHAAPTKVISLENTLGGAVLSSEECERITTWARSVGIKTHLDGARVWEAVAAECGAGATRDALAAGVKRYCAGFDSVSVCFSKGLGAPVGSMIAGSEAFVKRARHVRKSIGGGLRQSGVVAASARVAVEETFLGGKLWAGQEMARRVGGMWEGRGGRLEKAVETNMVWLDVEGSGVEGERLVEAGVKHGVKLLKGRVVVHYRECAVPLVVRECGVLAG